MVHEDGQVVHPRLGEEEGQGGGVHPPGDGEEDPVLPRPLPHLPEEFFQDVLRGPVPLGPGKLQAVLQDLHPLGGVGHLGVELDAVGPPVRGGDGGHGVLLRLRHHPPARGRGGHGVLVAHPDLDLPLEAPEEGALVAGEEGLAVLGPARPLHPSPELLGEELHAVADPEEGQARGEEPGVGSGGVGVKDASRPPREDEGLGAVL